jgi:hypothetical protein
MLRKQRVRGSTTLSTEAINSKARLDCKLSAVAPQEAGKYTRVLDTWFLVNRNSSIFEVHGPRRPQKPCQTVGGRPPFGMVSGAEGAAQTPNIDDFRSTKKPCMKNPGVDVR